MQAHARKASILVLLLPGIGAAQTLPCGECYDRVPQREPVSVYESLPGGDDPRQPAAGTGTGMLMRIPDSGGFLVGESIAGLRSMNMAAGVRMLILMDGRRVATAPFGQACAGSVIGSLTETFGGIAWRITGCSVSASVDEAFAQLRIEEARPSSSMPRYFVYAKSASGEYRLAEIGPREGQSADAAFDALSALTPAELDALDQRLREGARPE